MAADANPDISQYAAEVSLTPGFSPVGVETMAASCFSSFCSVSESR